MKRLIALSCGAACGLAAFGGAAAIAAPVGGPPMNSINNAFYVCDGGDANSFVVFYSGPKAEAATIRTAAQHKYSLARAPVSTGYMFKGGKTDPEVSFWTDGDRVSFTGAKLTYANCKLKTS